MNVVTHIEKRVNADTCRSCGGPMVEYINRTIHGMPMQFCCRECVGEFHRQKQVAIL